MISEEIVMRVGRDTHHHATRYQAEHKQTRRAVLSSPISRPRILASVAILYQPFPECLANSISIILYKINDILLSILIYRYLPLILIT